MMIHREKKMTPGGLSITGVEPGSIGEEMDIEPGDELLTINGKLPRDVIDYRFFIAEENLLVEIGKKNGERWELDIEKGYDEDLGLEFPPMKIRQCPNECEFCFVDQMPEGYRKSLYIRDEDYRFSFMYGNYITLTNLSKKDKERIFEQKLSPLYISVHTTDVELRKKVLQNDHAPPILQQISELTGEGIRLHTQIVLTPGLNDGLYLEKSVFDLAKFYPRVMSLAIVPVGLTKFREKLAPLEKVTPEYAREVIHKIHQWQEGFKKEFGYPFVFPADEMFIIGKIPVPAIEYYEDLPQLENGVGMVSAFLSDSEMLAEALPKKLKKKQTISIVTGVSFYDYFKKILERIKIQGLTFQLFPIVNDFLGHSVTMTGLMVGRDILSQLKGKSLGDALWVPSVALNEESHLFLDDTPFNSLEEELGVPVVIVESNAKGLFQFIESLAP
jgi:putative radical SAM enzyme (TIGR03279 family)